MIRILPELLKEEEGLGIHTSVLLLMPTFSLKYFYCHKEIRPFGDRISLQCGGCNAVRTLEFAVEDGQTSQYSWICICGWEDTQRLRLQNPVFLKPTNGAIIGWANQLLFGTRSTVDMVWKLPRESYNIM